MKLLNLGMLAHVDAGKTTTVEQMLFRCGVIRAPGSVQEGNTQTDRLAIERERGISVKTSSAVLHYKEKQINLVDTPGHMDFTSEVERALSAVDAVVLILSALEGVQSQTSRFWKAIRALELPALLFVNKIDRSGCEPFALLAQLRRELSPAIVPLNRPSRWGQADCQVHPCSFEEDELLALCENSDSFALRYLEGEAVTRQEAEEELRQQTLVGKAFPLVFGAASQGVGVDALLDAACSFLPGLDPAPAGPPAGVVYRVEHDKAMGKIAHVRLFSGSLHNRDSVELYRPGRPEPGIEKISQIRRVAGSRREDTGLLWGGDIGAVYGMNSAKTGDTIGRLERLRQHRLAQPLFAVRVYGDPARQTELLHAMDELSDEDPLLAYEWEPQERELTLRVMGTIQLEVLEFQLREQYGLQVTFSPPAVIYKETPAKAGEGYELYTMPKPCWAEVRLAIEPLPRGQGYRFASTVGERELPRRYQHHVEASVPETLRQGLLGWEVTDLKVTLVGGGHHLIHTHPLDFFLATPIAVMTGLADCGAQLLEPVADLLLEAPGELSGRLIGDVLGMRGEFDSPVIKDGKALLAARVPVATSMDYSIRFASLTSGKGSIKSEFAGYRECPLELGATTRRRGVNPLDRSKWILHKRSAIQ